MASEPEPEKIPLTHNSLEKLATNDMINSLKNILNNLLNETDLNSENLLYIVTNVMTAVGKYKTLSGSEKKEIVLGLINDAIDNIKDSDIKQILTVMMKWVVPNAIDLLIDISKKKYKFNTNSRIGKCIKSINCCQIK